MEGQAAGCFAEGVANSLRFGVLLVTADPRLLWATLLGEL